LYYRLLVVPIEVPPLRDRGTDIVELLHYFLEKLKTKHNKPQLTLPTELVSYFSAYRWPGNVRQLENALERLVVVSPSDRIMFDDLPDFLKRIVPSDNTLQMDFNGAAGMSLEAVERELIVRALRQFNGNQTRAARFLDLSRRTLGYRIDKYGIKVDHVKSEAVESDSKTTAPKRTIA